MKSGNNLVRHGAIVLVGTLVSNGLGYVYHAAMSRMLGVSGYGSMLGLFSIISLLAIPALVAQTVVAKIIAGYADARRVDRIRRFVRSLLPIAISVAVGIAAILYLARFALLAFLNSTDDRGVVIISWTILFYLIFPLLNGILQGEQRFRRLAIAVSVDMLLRSTCAVLLVAHGYGVNGALLGTAIGATVATIVSAFFVSDLLRAPERALETSGTRFDMRNWLRASVGILVISTLASIDVLLVKHFLSAYEAGLFGSLALIGRIVYLVAGFVPTVVLPKASARVSAGHSPVPLLLQAVIVFLAVLSTVVIPLLAFPQLLLKLVAGTAYAGAAPLLALYGAAIAFLAAAYAAANYNIGVNRLGFVVPVIIIGCGEIALIIFQHDSLATIVKILALGHFLIFLSTIFRIWVYAEETPTPVPTLTRDQVPS